MNADVSKLPFGSPALTAAQSSQAIQPLPALTLAGNVAALLFDQLSAHASAAPQRHWQMQVVDLPLSEPSRRRIRVQMRVALHVIGFGEAGASLSCGSRRAGCTLVGGSDQVAADGALPSRQRSLVLTLTLPRSTRPRSALRLVLLTEAATDGPIDDAMSTIDSLDVIAL